MSTKSTISRNKKYHLFEEVFDDLNIYLQLIDVEHKTRDNYYGGTLEKELTVTIPRGAWHNIIKSYLEKYGDEL